MNTYQDISLVMKTTDTAGDVITTTILNVNPEASNEQLFTLAQKLNAFTENMFRSVSKVTKEELLV